MKRSEVPLEQFEVQFNPEGLDNPESTKETMVTIMRFMDSTIFPSVEDLYAGLPDLNEIRENHIRNRQQGSDLIRVKNTIEDFIVATTIQVSQYIDKATLRALSIKDKTYLQKLLLSVFEKRIQLLEEIKTAAESKIDSFFDSREGILPLSDEENETERAVNHAGRNRRVEIDRLFQI